ncbi:MAG TPA: hypothetical protein V6D15_25710 [Oculatellaceae cyanobacterium]|jgi:biotin operon repressor
MYFPLQKLADTTGICGATIKGAEEDLSVLVQQFKECGFRVESSEIHLLNVSPDWSVNINFYVEQKEFLKSAPKFSAALSAIFEGYREDLAILIEQLKGCGFHIKTSDFYPSYRQPDQRMISRIYVKFEVAELCVLC